jgi:GTP cyclohydrolase FolE2
MKREYMENKQVTRSFCKLCNNEKEVQVLIINAKNTMLCYDCIREICQAVIKDEDDLEYYDVEIQKEIEEYNKKTGGRIK